MSFSSPYNFAPLVSQVFNPIAQKLNQDAPLENGAFGTIDIEIKNLNPLMIGDHQLDATKPQPFFKMPDGKPAIPGTSVKGMIRSMLETATGSAIQMDDNLFSQRDLTSASTEYMKTLKSKKTGWLIWSEAKSCWEIHPTESGYKTIRHTDDVLSTNTDVEDILDGFFPNERAIHKIESAVDRYEEILKAKPQLNKIGACVELKKDKFLVVTNQLEDCGKRREFLFTPPSKAKAFDVPKEVFQKFEYVMQEAQTDVGAAHWQYLKQFDKEGIPVFYISDQQNKIKAFGLPSLFRLPYEKRLFDLIPNSHRPKNINQLDFARLLFGDIGRDEHQSISRKGRVSFSVFKTQSVGSYKTDTVILNTPKASYYPAYLKQVDGDLKNFNKAGQITGFKRYLPHQNIKQSKLSDDNTNVQKQIDVLTSTHTFTGKVRVHNLTEAELGALLWALTLDSDNENYVHLLGMGKPLGYGKVKISIKNFNLDCNNPSDSVKTIRDYIDAFYTLLGSEDLLGEQLWTLKASMRKGIKPDSELHYLTLDLKKKKDGDDFEKMRKDKRRLGDLNCAPEVAELQAIQLRLEQPIATLKQTILDKKEQIRANEAAAEQARLDAEAEVKKADALANRNPVDALIEDVFEGEINKTALNKLIENPKLYENLALEDKAKLKQKIEINDWFRSLKKKRSDWRKKKLPNLLK
jgi:CRISPR-associated protein (TIGR03986 family)